MTWNRPAWGLAAILAAGLATPAEASLPAPTVRRVANVPIRAATPNPVVQSKRVAVRALPRIVVPTPTVRPAKRPVRAKPSGATMTTSRVRPPATRRVYIARRPPAVATSPRRAPRPTSRPSPTTRDKDDDRVVLIPAGACEGDT